MAEMTWMIDEQSSGLRLDIYLSRQVQALSRSGAAQVIRNDQVNIGGKSAKPNTILKPGDKVSYHPLPPKPANAMPQNIEVEVLYQDKDLAVINKPAGMVTHPSAGHHDGTLVNALLFHLDQLSGIGGKERPGIVHRLDKDTSGLMLVAKHDEAHQYLSGALQERKIRRYYDAVVWGRWDEQHVEIENNLGRDPKNRKRFAVVSRGGKNAKTGITVIDSNEWFSLVQCSLHTGRTHQIRIHCTHAGHPLVGDRTYSKHGEQSRLKRLAVDRPAHQLLHATKLVFGHLRTGKTMTFQCPWPATFERFIMQSGLKKK